VGKKEIEKEEDIEKEEFLLFSFSFFLPKNLD